MLSDHKRHKGHMSVFVPFVAIPGKRSRCRVLQKARYLQEIDSGQYVHYYSVIYVLQMQRNSGAQK